nr:MAG TPA: hypothetical protein [Caudoviricetes sp.]
MQIQAFPKIVALEIIRIFTALVPKWCPNFLWRYKAIRADIRKTILFESESTRCFCSLGCHASRGRRTCQRRRIYATFILTVDEDGWALLFIF